jgi:hypothetical protein
LPAILSMGQMDPTKLPKNFDQVTFWSSWSISLLVTISNGFLQLFSLDKNYFNYSLVVEQLKTEGWQFFGLSGKYEEHDTHNKKAYKEFCKAIENIKRKQVETEFQGKGNTTKKKPDNKNDNEKPLLDKDDDKKTNNKPLIKAGTSVKTSDIENILEDTKVISTTVSGISNIIEDKINDVNDDVNDDAINDAMNASMDSLRPNISDLSDIMNQRNADNEKDEENKEDEDIFKKN